jgi:hypothetical protein
MAAGRNERRPPRGAIAIVVAALLVVAALAVLTRPASAHPEPRTGITSVAVADASRYQDLPRVAETYRMAAEIAAVLDGLHCYCECDKHSDHYSLLDCFRSDHGAACDICLTEAQLAYSMTKEGKSLDEIRDAIDALYAH